MVDKSLDELVFEARGSGGRKGSGKRKGGGGGGVGKGAGRSNEAKNCPWTAEKPTVEGVDGVKHWLHDDRTGQMPGQDGDAPWLDEKTNRKGGNKGRVRDNWEESSYGPTKGGKRGRKGGGERSNPYGGGKGDYGMERKGDYGKGGRKGSDRFESTGMGKGGSEFLRGGRSAEAGGKWKHDMFHDLVPDFDDRRGSGRKVKGKGAGAGNNRASWDMHDDRW